jgi:hypothetical protein
MGIEARATPSSLSPLGILTCVWPVAKLTNLLAKEV